MAKRVSAEALAVLGRAEVDGPAVRLVGQLDRRLYTEVNAVLEAIGGRWNRKAKAHLFDQDAGEALEQVLLSGEFARPKVDFGFFETPPALVARLVKLADIRPGMTALEPSAGRGNIALALREAGADVVCCELQPQNREVLAANGFRLTPDADFLAMPARALAVDRVVMNPPFAKQADIEHVTRAYTMLRPGGRLVSVMAAGVTFRANGKATDFRALVEETGSILPNPDGSFRESGTDVRTVTVVMNAPRAGARAA